MAKAASKYRYERKYVIKGFYNKEIETTLKLHPAFFREIFHPRHINNIYFDDLFFKNYKENVNGDAERVKIRIRWYGDFFGDVSKPVLEYKIKKGLLGKKESYKLNPFRFTPKLTFDDIKDMIDSSDLPLHVREDFKKIIPTLVNRYKRKYFLSANKKYRVTIDNNLEYFKVSTHNNNFVQKFKDLHSTVVELKYDATDDNTANIISTLFPYRVSKNSKYVNGIDLFFVETI